MKIIIPEKIPSSNMVYGHRFSKKYLKKPYQELRKRIRAIVNKKINNLDLHIEDYIDHKLSVNVIIYQNWMTKSGEVARIDLANKQKFLIDSIFMELDIDDKFIWELNMEKRHSLIEEKAIVEIKPLIN